MFVDTPGNTMSLAANQNFITSDGHNYLLDIRSNNSMFFLANRAVAPSQKNYQDAAQHLSRITELMISAEHAKQLLALYPHARIKVADCDGVGATDVCDELAFVAAHFFLGCSWPVYKDKVHIDTFLALLQKQAVSMGFLKNPSLELL